MDQNLMAQELSDNELEQVVGGHCGKPKQPRGWCDHHVEHHCHEPKHGFPHFRHHFEPPAPCHMEHHCH